MIFTLGILTESCKAENRGGNKEADTCCEGPRQGASRNGEMRRLSVEQPVKK